MVKGSQRIKLLREEIELWICRQREEDTCMRKSTQDYSLKGPFAMGNRDLKEDLKFLEKAIFKVESSTATLQLSDSFSK